MENGRNYQFLWNYNDYPWEISVTGSDMERGHYEFPTIPPFRKLNVYAIHETCNSDIGS